MRDHPGHGTLGRRRGQGKIKIQKTVAFLKIIYYYWNQAGEATPTKARLTSLKTPEAILPGARKGLGLAKQNLLRTKPDSMAVRRRSILAGYEVCRIV